jgi:hypothetical protein
MWNYSSLKDQRRFADNYRLCPQDLQCLWIQKVPSKRLYVSPKIQDITTQSTLIFKGHLKFRTWSPSFMQIYTCIIIYMQSNKIHNVVLMSKFYSALMLARHVSDLIGPSSGAFCTSCIRRLWYVVLLCVLLDTSSRYKTVGRTCLLCLVPEFSTSSAHFL